MAQPGEIQSEQIAEAQPNPENVIPELREEPNFLAVRYNQQKKTQQKSRSGGAYVPPHKLRAMQQKIMEQDPNSVDHQRMMWELLRKSINGIVNKVNVTNIQNIVIELFNENILRGRGLLTKAIIKAQMASPNFTHVYAALISVINTKLPQIGSLLVNRVMLMFNRSFRRNNKIVCMATTKMIAHLVNQRVLGQFAALQLLMILLMHATEDSVQIACDFMTEVGQVLSEIAPAAASAIFQRFKNLLHQAEIQQKAQYSISKLFAVRKTGFKNHPGVIPELDLVQAEDQITHNLDFEEQLNGQQSLNFFREDPNFNQTQAEWDVLKLEILGQENVINLKQVAHYEEEVEQYQNQPQEQGIKDLTEQDLINLRRTIYLAIQSTTSFQQCAHKIMKMNITKGYEGQLIDMIIECCMMERIYQQFFGLLAERFCKIDDKYKELFVQAFVNYYNTIFKLEVSKIRNLGKLYGHLFYSQSIDWKIMEIITLKQDTTTAAHRMFLKILFRQIAQNMGLQKLKKQFQNPQSRQYYSGLFPIGHPNDVRFAINYWTTIGLGPLTQQMRQVLALQQQLIVDRKSRQQRQRIQQLMKEQMEMLMAEEQERAKEQERIMIQEKVKREQAEIRREKDRQKEKEKQKDRARDKQRDRRRDKSKSKQRSRSKDRDRDRDRSREKRKNKQRYDQQRQRSRSRQMAKRRDKERAREKQREMQKQLQRENRRKQQEREKQKQKQREKQLQKQKQREKQKQRIRQKEKDNQKSARKKKERSQSSSSNSSSSSSSSSSGQQTPKVTNKGAVVSKNPIQKIKAPEKQKQSSDSDSESSGLSSNSNEAENVKKVQSRKKQSAKVRRKSSSSSASSSSSSQTPIANKKQAERSRDKKQTQRKRVSSSSSSSQPRRKRKSPQSGRKK